MGINSFKSIVTVMAVLFMTNGYSQSNLLNAKTPSEIGQKTADQLANDGDKPLDYGYVDDRDVLWSKVVWEYVDLNERLNLPYYYPIDTTSAPKTEDHFLTPFYQESKQVKSQKCTTILTSRVSLPSLK